MALVKCPDCGNPVSDKAALCPHCGIDVQKALAENRQEQQKQRKTRRKRITRFLVAVFLVGAVAVLGYLYSIDGFNNIPADYREATNDYLEQCESAISKGDFDEGIWVLSKLRGRKLTNRQTKCFEKERKAVIEMGLIDLENTLASVANEMNDKVIKRAKEEMVTLSTLQLDASQAQRLRNAKDLYVELQLVEIERTLNLYNADPQNQSYYARIVRIAQELQVMELSTTRQERLKEAVMEAESIKTQTDRRNNPLDYLDVTSKSVGFIRLGDYASRIPSKGEFYDKVKKEIDEYTEWWIDVHYDLYLKGEKILELSVDDNDRITSISICTPKIKLENGIHIGMTPQEIENKCNAKFIVTEGEGLWLKYVVPGYESCQLVGGCPEGWVLSNGETLDYDDVGRELPARLLMGCKLEHIHLVSW